MIDYLKYSSNGRVSHSLSRIVFCFIVCLDCGILPSLTNGTVDQTGGTLYLDTTHFTCDLGYNLQGTSVRTCGPDGTWDNAQPTCEIAGAHDAFAVKNISLSKNTVFVDIDIVRVLYILYSTPFTSS